MTSDERWFPSHLKELGEPECLELLAEHHVGRVAYCDDLGPVVLPVNYAVDQGTILIQTPRTPRSQVACAPGPRPFRSTSSTSTPRPAGASWSADPRPTSTRQTYQQTKIARTRGRRAGAHSTSESPHTTSPAADSCPPDLAPSDLRLA
jgi:hypothetical protein